MADIWFQIKFLQFLEWFRRSEFILGPNVGDCTSEVRRFCFNAKVENVRVVKWKKDHLAQTAAADHTKQKQNEEKKKSFFRKFENWNVQVKKISKQQQSIHISVTFAILMYFHVVFSCVLFIFLFRQILCMCVVYFTQCLRVQMKNSKKQKTKKTLENRRKKQRTRQVCV